MKSDIRGSYIPVPVPTELYVGLLDHLKSLRMSCEPEMAVASILQKYLNTAQKKPPRPNAAASAPDWSNDWIMFESPPSPAREKTPRSRRKPAKAQSSDWCIGCGCPSEDLLSC